MRLLPNGLRKLGGSETFWCCAIWGGAWTGLHQFGIDLPMELVMTAIGVHGLKEGAGKIGAGMSTKAKLVHVSKVDPASDRIVEAVAEEMRAKTAANVDAGRI